MDRTLPQEESLQYLVGIVERVTYHNPENGWTVLKVASFRESHQLTTVLIHQAKVFAGATMEFWGAYVHHPQHGEQFKAVRALEKKPASAAALEKYLGSGLIKGVGPATAKKIVKHFRDSTLDVFEKNIEKLMEVPGIANKKIITIKNSWMEHRSIRDVMIFLQGYGISTLFATKIYKTYGDKAIEVVKANPYRLAHDIYGIGFFSADKIALNMGFDRKGSPRIEAGMKQILAASRDEGHCFLTEGQMLEKTLDLLGEKIESSLLLSTLQSLCRNGQIMHRALSIAHKKDSTSLTQACYYSKTLYYDEKTVADRLISMVQQPRERDSKRIENWVNKYCESQIIQLSEEQKKAVISIPHYSFSILTGGPGCGKTTCTKVLVQLLRAMKQRILLAAPTGRAAQRMSEVVGIEAKTIHRLLQWLPAKGGFKKNETDQLEVDFLIVDETSMIDVSLTASLLKAVPNNSQILFIGDPDQLPAVGAGDVLRDFLQSPVVPRFCLTQVFRQAQSSSIIRFAHEINRGKIPLIVSPLSSHQVVSSQTIKEGMDCLFIDSEEATQEQLKFLNRAKLAVLKTLQKGESHALKSGDEWLGYLRESGQKLIVQEFFTEEPMTEEECRRPILEIPEKFKEMNWNQLSIAQNEAQELLSILKKISPWSSLHYGLTAVDSILRLYTKSIREWMGEKVEIQILSPQLRGSVGTLNLNQRLQNLTNPPNEKKYQMAIGNKIFREGDRVIQTRNNYDLEVFNGDIGHIVKIDSENLTCEVVFHGIQEKKVEFAKEDLSDLSLAYAITIHKSQGSEFPVVIIPLLSQHYNMLFRNLIYTGLTRAKKLAIFVGSRKAMAMAIQKIDNRQRQTALSTLINENFI